MEKDAALDAGGYARLDISDVLSDADLKNETGADAPVLCDRCAEPRRTREYLVVADNRHYAVCPTCWGRSPGYVELRRLGIHHEAALIKIGVSLDSQQA